MGAGPQNSLTRQFLNTLDKYQIFQLFIKAENRSERNFSYKPVLCLKTQVRFPINLVPNILSGLCKFRLLGDDRHIRRLLLKSS